MMVLQIDAHKYATLCAKDDRVFVIHKHNGGLSSARNAGLERAHGAFIGFVDSDDYIASDMYESMLTNLQKEDADIAFTSSAHVYEDGSISTKHLVQGQYLVLNTEEAFKYINLPGYFGIAAWDKLVKRELLNEICFPENVVRDEDYGFRTNCSTELENSIRFDSEILL